MAQWRKVIVSGSNAELNNINSSGNVVPTITDGGSLGTSALNWSDLFLDSGAVVNFDGGDVTLTHSGNLLDIDGGNTRVDRLELDSASDYLDVSTDLQVIAAADITLDPAGGNVKPASNDDAALGVAGTGWSDLFLAEGAVINWDSGDFTATQVGNLLTLTGGSTRVDKLEIDGANDSIDVSTDMVLTSAADITLAAGGANVKPNANNTIALGVSGTAFSDLFLGSGAVVNFNAGDVTLTHSANALTVGGGDVLVGDNNVSGSSASTGSFGYLNVHGDGVFGGNLTFGDAASDSVSFGADIDSNLIPNTDDTYDLGSAAQAWQDLFLEGDITLTDAGSVKATAGNLTVDSEAGSLVLDGHTGVDIDASNSGKVAIDGAGGIDIGVAADVAIDVDSSTFDLDASGALTMTSTTMAFDPSSTFDLDAAGAITIDGASITLGGDSDTAFDIDTSTLDIDASGAVTIDTSAGGVSIDAAAASNFSTAAGALLLHGAGGINIGTTADVAIDVDAAAFDLDASGALTMTSTTMAFDPSSTFDLDAAGAITIDGASITLGGDSDTAFDIDTSTLDIDSSGAITIDSTAGVSIDGATASNVTTAAGALTLDGGGGVNIQGNAAEVDITTSGAVDINSGAFTLNGSTVGIDGSGALTLGASEMDIDADGGVINMDATSTITIGGTNSTGVTIGKSDTTVTIPGSLDVNGTLTTIDTTNLKVADRFILMASGSSAGDGGIVVETNGAGSGTALGYDDSASRWALSKQDDTSHSSTTITPRQYVVSVSGSAVDASSNPSDFGSSATDRIGMMHVNTSTGDIFIFS